MTIALVDKMNTSLDIEWLVADRIGLLNTENPVTSPVVQRDLQSMGFSVVVTLRDYDCAISWGLPESNLRHYQCSFSGYWRPTPRDLADLNEFCLYELFHNHPKRPEAFVRWNKQSFNPKILKLPNNVYLEGYWQSEKYFIGIENIIRNEFTIKTPPADKNKELGDIMNSCESVAVSVRRGDFVTDPRISKTHGACSNEYYYKCTDLISQKTDSPVFFVFSDDIQWCKDDPV